jgi:DNA polymerase III subunit epsilon
LNLVCEHLQIPLNHHNALSDAEACARIVLEAEKMKSLKPALRNARW